VRGGGAAVMLAVLLGSSAALAYVLPMGSILRRMIERRDDAKLGALAVQGTVVIGPALAKDAGALGLSVGASAGGKVAIRLPGRCRLELSAEGRSAAAVMAAGKRRAEGPAIEALGVAVEALCELLAVSSAKGEGRAGLERHLRQRGVDPKTTLGRLGGQVAYVIGARSDGQAWVYKDTFQPARLRYTDAQGGRWDVRLLSFGSPVAADLFPRIFEVHRNDELALRFTALSADPKANLPDTLF
jgi:hypothetical protein